MYSQINLIPNYSFEDYDSLSQWYTVDSMVNNWFSPEGINNKINALADYYNEYNKNINCSVPSNFNGYQTSHSGSAYIGLVFIGSVLNYDYRENIETKLIEPLKNGYQYNVKLHYVYAESTNNFDTSYKLGLLFTDTIVHRYLDSNTTNGTRFYPIMVQPQLEINISNPIDSINWKTEEFTCIANGGEQYLTIGSFGTVNILPYQIYLYLDDISVIPIYPAKGGGNKKLCIGDSILIGGNNYTEYEYCWFKKGSADTLSKQGQFWVQPDTTTTYILHQYYESKYFSADTVVVDASYSYCHKENSLLVFPNPSAGDFLFQMKNPINSEVSIEILDVIGRKVKESKFTDGSYRSDYPLNMSGIGSGAYIYRLKYNEGSFSGRLMVVRE